MLVMKMNRGFLLLLLLLPLSTAHNKYDHPNKPSHVDFDPVIDFPDADPNAVPGQYDRLSMEADEMSHYMTHSVIGNVVHTKMSTAELLRKIKQSMADGTYIHKPKGPPYVSLSCLVYALFKET